MGTPSARNTALLLALILCAGGALRIWVALRNPIPAGDGVASEVEMARNLTEGRGFSTMRKWTTYDQSMAPLRPEGNRQPAMAVILAGAFLLFGTSFATAQGVSLFLGLACILVAYRWASKAFSQTSALLTAAWLALDPLFIWFSTQPDSLMLFTTVFLLVLIAGGEGPVRPGRAAILGLLCGAAWLVRTQGLLMALGTGIWMLFRGRPRIGSAAVFAGAFLAAAMPWMIRNIDEFGRPFYSQAFQTLFTTNHNAVWEVRQSPIDPMEGIRAQSLPGLFARIVEGFSRVLEPFVTGTLHRGEPFAGPSLGVFSLAALIAMSSKEFRRRLSFPAAASILMALALTAHVHPGRYLSFAIVVIIAAGFEGLGRLLSRVGAGRGVMAGTALLLLLTLLRPLGLQLRVDSRARAAESREIARWIAANSSPGDWVVTFPNVEMFVWQYQRPTLTMPDDYEMLVWPYLERHRVRYLVVDPNLPLMRPWLSRLWEMSPDGSGWERIDPPPFLTEVHRSGSGRSIVYEWTGTVPAGYMAVDSIPPDNSRALPPGTSQF